MGVSADSTYAAVECDMRLTLHIYVLSIMPCHAMPCHAMPCHGNPSVGRHGEAGATDTVLGHKDHGRAQVRGGCGDPLPPGTSLTASSGPPRVLALQHELKVPPSFEPSPGGRKLSVILCCGCVTLAPDASSVPRDPVKASPAHPSAPPSAPYPAH